MGFKDNFLWGTSTSATQIEGAYLQDGKSLSVWDALSYDGRIKNNETTCVACDHYNRYKEDIALMRKIGVNSYRFSINWARVVVDAKGTINEKGLAFYNDLVDELLKADIQPMVTLYHWDLPMWMHDRGGWKNPEVVDYFLYYVDVVVKALSDRVKYWITFNEPQCFVEYGYGWGVHAPFEKNPRAEVDKISRNVMLAHGRAVSLMREAAKQPLQISFSPANYTTCPKDESLEELERAKKITFDGTNVDSVSYWSDPIVLGKRAMGQEFLSDEDLKVIAQPLDFYSYNIYHAIQDKENPRFYVGMPKTANVGWPITPECLYWAAKYYAERYQLPIIVTENGMANIDYVMSDGCVHDPQRSDFIKTYLQALKKASDEVDVVGYYYWSFIDNFEWAQGYDARFGLVYVDYSTQKRTIKDSAYVYRDIIQSNGENI